MMARIIDPVEAQRVLERAARAALKPAGRKDAVQRLWEDRCREAWTWSTKTAIAALGTALLAKATDGSVDALSLKPSSGGNGYAARSLESRVLAAHRQTYQYILGTSAPDPLANSPWYEPDRIDRIKKWRHPQVGAELVSWLSTLAGGDAFDALVAFVRVAKAEAQARAASATKALNVTGSVRTLEQLLDGVQTLATLDAEDGRIGAAAVAAAYAAAGHRVEARVVNDPGQTDVDVYAGRATTPTLGCEVKQKIATDQDARDIAAGAREIGSSKALLAALHPRQPHLDRDGLCRWADEQEGVLLDIAHGFRDLFVRSITSGPATRAEFLGSYAKHMSHWLVELEASEQALDRWAAIVRRWVEDAI